MANARLYTFYKNNIPEKPSKYEFQKLSMYVLRALCGFFLIALRSSIFYFITINPKNTKLVSKHAENAELNTSD